MRYNESGVIGEIDNLPGCSQIAVFHSVFIPAVNRAKGLGAYAHKKRLELAADLVYDVSLCTVNLSNTAQLKILESNGWKKVHEFFSRKTNNNVGIFVKDL